MLASVYSRQTPRPCHRPEEETATPAGTSSCGTVEIIPRNVHPSSSPPPLHPQLTGPRQTPAEGGRVTEMVTKRRHLLEPYPGVGATGQSGLPGRGNDRRRFHGGERRRAARPPAGAWPVLSSLGFHPVLLSADAGSPPLGPALASTPTRTCHTPPFRVPGPLPVSLSPSSGLNSPGSLPCPTSACIAR